MSKIRTLIAHNEEDVKNEIVDSIKGLEYVEIVGIATNGTEAYNKIVDLKPEIVFAKHDFNNMTSIDIMKRSKEKLDNNIPVFNIIVDDISNDDLKQAQDIVGNKLGLIRRPYPFMVTNVLSEYKDYMNK